MNRLLMVISSAVVLCWLPCSASALPPGMKMEFDGKGAGKVLFDGPAHKAKGLICKDCHTSPTKLFEMKKGTDVITMKDMDEGKFCGACHNGTKAFSTKDAASCEKCHKK